MPFPPGYVHHGNERDKFHNYTNGVSFTTDWALVTCPTCLRNHHDLVPKDHPMTAPIPYTMTNDQITLVHNGSPHTVLAGTAAFRGIREAIFREAWGDAIAQLSPHAALRAWLRATANAPSSVWTSATPVAFTVDDDGTIKYGDEVVPRNLATRIVAMADAGESPVPLLMFYKRLQKNPSKRSVDGLFRFLGHLNIPIEPDGTFLAYKGVREDLLDRHSGKIDNTPGQTITIPRNQVSDDPNTPCHEGLHVGALSYAADFASRVVICRVDPEHVVCVPYDESQRKMRVCEYTVIGHHNGTPMPSTTFVPDVEAKPEPEWDGDPEDLDDDVDNTGPGAVLDSEPLNRSEDEDEDDEDDEDEDEDEDRAARAWDGDHEHTPPPAPTAPKVKPAGPKAAQFNRMSPTKLIEQGIEELRKYASAHLKIVGASKLPGGKSALVSAIMKARKRRSR